MVAARLHAMPHAQAVELEHNPTKLAQMVPPSAGLEVLWAGTMILLVALVGLVVLGITRRFGRTSEEAAARIRLRRAEQQLAQQLGAAAQLKAGVYIAPPLSAAAPSPAEAPTAAEEVGAAEEPTAEQLVCAEHEVPLGRRLRADAEAPINAKDRLAQVAQDSLTLPALWEVTHSRLGSYSA